MSTTPQAAAALSAASPLLRTPVRSPASSRERRRVGRLSRDVADVGARVVARCLAVAVIGTVMIAVVGTAHPTRVEALPLTDRAASYIAVHARAIALELRRSEGLSVLEQQSVAGRQIDELATLVAYLLDVDSQPLRQVWFAAPLQRKIALFSALSQVGVPYRINADAPFIALDCSALTKFAWAQAGVDIERGSQYQYSRATRVSRDAVQVGDLVWYPGHIMLSLGVDDLIVHARSGNRAVEIHRIASTRMSWMRWVSPLE